MSLSKEEEVSHCEDPDAVPAALSGTSGGQGKCNDEAMAKDEQQKPPVDSSVQALTLPKSESDGDEKGVRVPSLQLPPLPPLTPLTPADSTKSDNPKGLLGIGELKSETDIALLYANQSHACPCCVTKDGSRKQAITPPPNNRKASATTRTVDGGTAGTATTTTLSSPVKGVYDVYMSNYEAALAKEAAYISPNGFIYQGAGNVVQKGPKLHYQLFIGNLTDRTSLGDLARALRNLSVYDVEHINIFHNPVTNKSKGFGMVILGSKKSYTVVMTRMPQMEINGRRPEIALDFESAQAEFDKPQRKWTQPQYRPYEERSWPQHPLRWKSPQNQYARNM